MKKLIFILLLPSSLFAQRDFRSLLDQFVQAEVKINGFSGAVLVMQHDKVLLEKAYGFADREWSIPNTSQTKFLIGSITKQFTAACILQLSEQNRLDLNDKLDKYFPDFPKGDSVDLNMLLHHTSGIADYTEQPEFHGLERLSLSKDSMIRFFKNKPYNFSPGTNWSYSNSNYFLLGCIVEKVSCESYSDYLRKHILDKIGMHNSGVDNLDSIIPKLAKGYTKVGNNYRNALWISMEWPFSAGAIYSTVGDMYKWDRALYQNKILSDRSKKKMFAGEMKKVAPN